MSIKQRKIIEISNQANTDEIELWTNSFKARGILLKDLVKATEGVVTLINARIIPIFSDSGCVNEVIVQDWLNVFEEQIIAFTAIRK